MGLFFAFFGNWPTAGVGICDSAVTTKWVVTGTPHMDGETSTQERGFVLRACNKTLPEIRSGLMSGLPVLGQVSRIYLLLVSHLPNPISPVSPFLGAHW
jgi:hypothetical protein